jgi:hypothetical protein
VNQFINVYEKLFNAIFDNGIVPSSWLIGMIKPIYKNKGQTVSKAFIKSTNAQYIFFFLHFRIKKKRLQSEHII